MRLTINGKVHDVDVEPDTPLLWAIRENVGLTGTKYGCGIALCGACTVHLDGVAVRSSEISVERATKIKIHRIIAATDPGYAVNPAQIERQVSGSFVYGLSALFYGECTIRGGRVEQQNFDTYNSMRIAEMPKVETIIMPTEHTPWGGVGEPTICVAAPAVLNAYFKATGKSARSRSRITA